MGIFIHMCGWIWLKKYEDTQETNQNGYIQGAGGTGGWEWE